MANTLTLEQVEELAVQLPLPQQLKLVSHMTGRASFHVSFLPVGEESNEFPQKERLRQLESWLSECEQVAVLWEGEFDPAADLRGIRNEEA